MPSTVRNLHNGLMPGIRFALDLTRRLPFPVHCAHGTHTRHRAAGAARDLAKLAALGRVGENGSEEVAKGYAKRCVEEVQAASALLSVLATSVQQ